MINGFVALIAVSGLAHIISDYREKWSLTFIFKPLTMLIIISMVLIFADLTTAYTQWIVAGLVLSLIGDVFLMLRPQRFMAGLASFLLAHILYVIAFYDSVSTAAWSWIAGWFLPVALIYLAVLWKHLKKYRWPVVGYFMAIGAMLFFAGTLLLTEFSIMSKLAFLGALLFALSDGVLAWRKFVKPLKFGQLFIMATYFSAQTLIALSAVYYWN